MKCLFMKWVSGTWAKRKVKCLLPNNSTLCDLWVRILRQEKKNSHHSVFIQLTQADKEGSSLLLKLKWYSPKQWRQSLNNIDKVQEQKIWHFPISAFVGSSQEAVKYLTQSSEKYSLFQKKTREYLRHKHSQFSVKADTVFQDLSPKSFLRHSVWDPFITKIGLAKVESAIFCLKK